MSNEKPNKVDPAYPSGGGLSMADRMAMRTIGAAAGLDLPVVGPAAVQPILTGYSFTFRGRPRPR